MLSRRDFVAAMPAAYLGFYHKANSVIGAPIKPQAVLGEGSATRIGNYYYKAPNGIAFIKDDAAAFVINPGGSHNAGTVAPDDSFHRVIFSPQKTTTNIQRVEFQ